jgi:hypothetical protein
MVSSRIAYGAIAVVVLIGALSGCTSDPSSTSPSASTETGTSTAQASGPVATPTSTDIPVAPAPPASIDPAAGLAAAVRACQAVASGFSAANVAAATPLAAEAAQHDPDWQTFADDLAFIDSNPIDPETGEGPQQTIDDATAVAQVCFSRAGVQVSQD